MWPWLLGLFLAGFGAKVWLINRSGSPLPFWDEWGEAWWAYAPYFEHRLHLLDLFSGHNETRPFFTRIFLLGLLVVNGQWDAQLEMVLNAAVHALTITGFAWLVARRLGGRVWPWLWLAMAAVVVPPFAWENTLAGLHSQFYFMVSFSLAAIWLLIQFPSWSFAWWLGILSGFCAIFNVASGFIASSAVFALVLLRILRSNKNWNQHVPTLAVCAAISLSGVLLKVDVPHHERLRAHSVMDFVIAMGNNLAWPWIVVGPWAIFNFLPTGLLAWYYLRSREQSVGAEELTLATGFWTLISAAATAFARGAGGATPQWRYMDATSFALPVNAIAILIILQRYRSRGFLGRLESFAALAWAIANAAGLFLLVQRACSVDIPEREFYQRVQLRHVRIFMVTDRIPDLGAKVKEERSLTFPNILAWILRYPDIRSRLPACAREPLPVVPSVATNSAFVPRGYNLNKPDPATEISWGSFNSQGTAAVGTFESQPVRASRFPYLQIDVAGDLGKPGLSLELEDIATHQRTPIVPRAPPGPTWEHCEVRAPPGKFIIVAKDESPTGWFAFKEPRELSRLSCLNIGFMRLGPAIFFAGIALYLAGIGIQVCLKRTGGPCEDTNSD
jgi:hypothetical protein